MKCYVWLVKVERSILGSDHVVVASVYVEKTRPSASGKYIFYEEQCIRYLLLFNWYNFEKKGTDSDVLKS